MLMDIAVGLAIILPIASSVIVLFAAWRVARRAEERAATMLADMEADHEMEIGE
jgi:hypothetical protein